jgi:hypothetical protein
MSAFAVLAVLGMVAVGAIVVGLIQDARERDRIRRRLV